MRKFRLALLAVGFALLAGCAATGPLYEEVSASIPSVPQGQGRIYFYRPDTMLGAAVTSDINLNGKVVGKSERGSFFFVDQAPGSCTVATSTEVERHLTFTLGAGEIRYVKTTVSMGVLVGHISPELVGTDVGKSDIAGLHYTGSSPLVRK